MTVIKIMASEIAIVIGGSNIIYEELLPGLTRVMAMSLRPRFEILGIVSPTVMEIPCHFYNDA